MSFISGCSVNESMADCSPLTPSCIKGLTDRLEERRKFAANEVEKMSLEFSLANNLTMINRLIIVLTRKFCLSQNPNARKGGLLGLGAVMVGFNNGSVTKVPPEIIEEIVRPILTCLLDADARVRYYACESLYNVTKVAKGSILAMFHDIFDNMTKLVADTDVSVRSGVEVLDKLLKDIVNEEEQPALDSFVLKLDEYLYAKNPFTRMFIVSWICVLDSKIDIIKHLPHLLDGIFCCLCDATEEIRAFTLGLLSEFLNKIVMSPADRVDVPSLVNILLKHARNEREDVVQYTAIAWVRQLIGLMDESELNDFTPGILSAILPCLASHSRGNICEILSIVNSLIHATGETSTDSTSQSNANVLRVMQALCKTFRENESIFNDRGTLVVLNLCSIIKPDIIYKSFAEIILKEEKADSKFTVSLIQKLNHILLTTQPLSALRSRLSTSEDDADASSLFQSLYEAWSLSPISALTLCLLANNYKDACEIIIALSQRDINVDILTQIDWVVQLIESPVFAPLRMRLLDVENNQYLLQALYGILMILPQSEAYRRLGHRLDQVYKFMCSQAQFKPKLSRPLATNKPSTARGSIVKNSDGNR